MADIKSAAKGVYAPLESTITGAKVVRDAWKLELAEGEEYIESEVALEKLEFASSALGGLGAAAAPPAEGTVRSSSTVTVPLADSGGGTDSASRTVTLFGPGDVRGLDSAQIIRRYPAPGTWTAEETVLAHIEFDRPELPWAFSPAGQSVKPWLALVVVPRTLVEWEPAVPGMLLPVIRVPADQLPPLADSHLWAHAQASRNVDADKPLDARLSPAHAPVNLSRIVSPRVLRDSTAYVAALVPTFDVGRRRGLGLTEGSLDDAWGSDSDDLVRLPVYDSWEFATGPDGDFKELALRLQGVVAPYEVGRRFIDMSIPGKPLRELADGESGAKQVLRCALFSPTEPATPEQEEAEEAQWPATMTDEMRQELDRPGVIERAAPSAGESPTVPDLPIVGPRIYAKLHRGAAVIEGDEDADWFAELNLKPTMRIVGGLGTRVVQKDQEPLMQAAWAQLGDVLKANRAIALAQLAERLATRLHARLSDLDLGRLVQVTAPLSTRVSLTPGTTLSAAIDASATPSTVKLGAYRRVTRPGGPMVRRADDASRLRAGMLVAEGTGLRDFTRVYRNPEGISGLSVATHLTHPERWADIDASFDPGRVFAQRWSEQLLRPPAIAALEEVRAQRVGPLMADLSLAKPAADAPFARRLKDAAAGINDRLIERLGGGARGDGRARQGRRGGTRPGRVTVDRVEGLRAIDVGELTRIGDTTDVRVKNEALGKLAALADVKLSPALDAMAQLSLAALREGMAQLVDPGGVLAIERVPRRETLSITSQQLTGALDPKTTVRNALEWRVQFSPKFAELGEKWVVKPYIAPIMAAPRFDWPMYRALDGYDREWLIPGVGLLPESDFVTVLSTNDEFMEAFLVGLSDELGRELLWRGYPTDRRGTYFHRFWSPGHDELTEAIHAFSRKSLGAHVAIGGVPADDGGGTGSDTRLGRAVIFVKSELVKRFPDLIIQAVKNHGTPQEPVFEAPGQPQETADVLFAEYLEPDIALVGLDLSVEELDEPGWWIVIAEHPSATRFELPGGEQFPDSSPDHLSTSASDAAAFADTLLHNPTRVAFEATDLIVTGA